MLTILLISLILLGLLYFSNFKEGYVICFLFLFFVVLDILLSSIGYNHNRLLIRLIFALILLFGNYRFVIIKLRYLFNDKIVMGILILLISMLLHNFLIFDTNTYKRITFQNDFLIYSFLPFLLILIVIDKQWKIKQFSNSIIYYGILFYLIFYFYVDISKIVVGNRMSIDTTNKFDSIGLSRISAIIFITSYMNLLHRRWFSIQVFSIVALILSFFFILLSGQRGTIIGIILGFLAYALFNIKWKYIYILLISIVILQLGIIDFNKFRIIDRFAELSNYNKFERFKDYSVVWNIFKDNKFIFGEGSVGYFFKTGRTYPHNMFLELIAEYGILGLISGLLIVISGFRYSYNIFKSKILSHAAKNIANIWIMLFFSAMVSSNLISNNLFFVFTALLISITTFSNHKLKRKYSMIYNHKLRRMYKTISNYKFGRVYEITRQ